ncbi:DUF192 domain-containing protein [Teichococcus oryzae]|uniref:DUF192 domain-containing protein n=1 Tax=Teichococcus oryzae TaxID=1608942 RepID=A0A5B2TLA9_9PROT|nr:DUF192 domain-containing protein [Pseudoroseomonas oryzae]KAA2214979.1 DUF192 domain-containing protein [Pseudoroseomonas oryzae]
MHRRTLLALPALAIMIPPAAAQDAAQPRLPTEPLFITTRDGRRHAFTVEMALTPEQQTVGLMFRREVKPDEGMLFDWGTPRDSAMWMRNTLVSLDMVFIAADGRIHRIAERTVPLSLATVESRGPVRATLELAAGTAERLGLRVGDRVENRIFGQAPRGTP